MTASDQFYLQDSRQIVGNDMMWWAKGGNGYTSDVSKAEVFTRERAQRQHSDRVTDIPWPKAYIDAKTHPVVDVQYVNHKEALEGAGITLIKPAKPKRDQYRCYHCGVFLTMRDFYGDCPKCGGDNRP